MEFVLSVRNADEDQPQATTEWVLESGLGRYLFNDLSLLKDVINCNHNCFTAASDRRPLRITKQGSAAIHAKARVSTKIIQLLDD